MANYIDNEQRCQNAFNSIIDELGPMWHICTPGELSYSFNSTDDDYKFSVSNIAISAAEAGLTIITDQVMSNHLHVIAAGDRFHCIVFMDVFRYRLLKYLKVKGLYYKMEGFDCKDPIAINSLQMARREIVYCNRNGYLADPSETPFSYRWGGGSLYFNPFAQEVEGIPSEKIPYRVKRELSFRSAFDIPSDYAYKDGMILPASYVDFRRGQELFRNAHHYFNMLCRDFETFSGEALRYGDKVVVTDEEMFSVVMTIVNRDYKGIQPTLLPPSLKVELARKMFKEYRATSQQIRRILKLDKSVVDQILGH